MTPERWQQVDKLLERALECEPSQRVAFLDEACAGNTELRQEVEALLDAHQQAATFLSSPAVEIAAERGVKTSPHLLVGQGLGHYQILSLLGEGGMGVVYKARDTRLDRTVAIKALPAELVADPERKLRFVREAKAASALNHPNIITIHDILCEGNADFIVMEYLAGQTLGQLMSRRKKLPLNKTLNYAIQLAEALVAAHHAGIIHRDLKPGNIMVSDQGLVKVLDFGLAKLAERPERSEAEGTETGQVGSDPRTKEGAILGTVSYMSPEQAEGKRVDARSDIFSFGAVFYEMVTGRRAFQGDSVLSTLTAILREDPKPVSQLADGVPPELERIIHRCLRKEPERRWQAMADVKVALQELQEEVTRDKPVPALKVWPRRRWLWMAVLAASLSVTILFSIWLARSNAPKASLNIVPLTSYPGLESGPSFSPDGNQVTFSWNGERQDNFDIYIKLIGSDSLARLTSDPAVDFSSRWSPDGRWIAFLREVSTDKAALFLIPPIGGRERMLSTVGGWHVGHQNLTWSPDSKWLAVPDMESSGAPQGLYLVSIESGERKRLTLASPGSAGDLSPVFSPDGKIMAFSRFVTGWASDLYLLPLSADFSPQQDPKRLTFESRRTFSPAWTPDGHEILFVSGGQHHPRLWRVPASGSERPERLPFGGGGGYLFDPTISRQGTLAFSQLISDINIWRIEIPGSNGRAGPPMPLIASTFLDHTPQFSPNGARIAFASYRSGNAEIWVCDSDGSNALQLTSFKGWDCSSPSWSPDGRLVAFSAQLQGQSEIHIIGAEGGRPRRLTNFSAGDGVPSFSRDGKWLYFDSKRTGEWQVWKMPAEGGERIQMTRNGGSLPLESHDGKYIYYLKGNEIGGSLWKAPAEGGEENEVLSSVFAVNYAVTRQGIYFMPEPDSSGRYSIQFFKFATGKTQQLALLGKRVMWGFSVSADERWILYPQVDHEGSDLMMVENFR